MSPRRKGASEIRHRVATVIEPACAVAMLAEQLRDVVE
jgi:hypothetical protein